MKNNSNVNNKKINKNRTTKLKKNINNKKKM